MCAKVRHEAAEALGAIATEECLTPLQDNLQDPAQEVRETCMLALRRLQEAKKGMWMQNAVYVQLTYYHESNCLYHSNIFLLSWYVMCWVDFELIVKLLFQGDHWRS